MVAQKRRIPKSAILAGAAIVAPIAAHAGPIVPALPATITSTSSDVSVNIDLLGNGDFEFGFTASLTNHEITVTPNPLSDSNITGAQYVGTNDFTGFCSVAGPCIPAATPFFDSSLISLLNPFISSPAGILQKTTGTNGTVKGPWPNDGSFRYLGISFTDRGTSYLGWIQLSAQICDQVCNSTLPAQLPGTVTSAAAVNPFAALTLNDASVSVVSPEPASIALLALGAAGLAVVRARRKNNA